MPGEGSAATRSPGKESRGRRLRATDERSGEQKEKQRDHRRNEKYAIELCRDRPLERAYGLVEIHDFDDPEIIEGRDDAGDDADHGEPGELCIDRREKHVELGEKSGSRRDPA